MIQLLVRKHSQDARRQRAIALKSLAVGFVVRENVFRYFRFFLFLSLSLFLFPLLPNVFSIGFYPRKTANGVAIRRVVIQELGD